MGHLTIELLLWLLLALFVGAVFGCLLRKLMGGEVEPAISSPTPAASGEDSVIPPAGVYAGYDPMAVMRRPGAAEEPKREAKPAPAPASPAPQPATPSRPKGLAQARGGKADDLKRISGVGPKIEKTLHSLGFFHFDQIAAWTPGEVEWVDDHLRFKGRIAREEWIAQAKLLAAGDEDTFARRYGTGGLKDKSGKTRSGTRTRKR